MDKTEIALREVKQMHSEIYSAGNDIDRKAISLLSSTSLILALFGVMQIDLINRPPTGWAIWGLISAVSLFVCLVGIVFVIISPKDYRLVFKATWRGVNKAILKQQVKMVNKQLISNYLARIKHNKSINEGKNKLLRLALFVFTVEIILLVFLSVTWSHV